MGLFTELAKHPEDLDALTGRLGLHPRGARDFLDALVALGFLERRNGKYFNTSATDLFLDRRKPSYIGGMLEMANHRLYEHWSHLTEGLEPGSRRGKFGAAVLLSSGRSTRTRRGFASFWRLRAASAGAPR